MSTGNCPTGSVRLQQSLSGVMSFLMVYEFTFVLLEIEGKVVATCMLNKDAGKNRLLLSFIIKTHAREVYYLSFITVRNSNTDVFSFTLNTKEKSLSFSTNIFLNVIFFLPVTGCFFSSSFSRLYFILLTTALFLPSKGSQCR